VAVTTKSSFTGALHTKFHSTSSDSSSSSSSSSSDGGSSSKAKKNQTGKPIGYLTGESQWDKVRPLPTPGVGGMGKKSPRENFMRGNSSRRGRSRGVNKTGRKPHPDLIVGGPNDVLSTRSKIYSRGRGRVDRSHVNLIEVVSAVKETLKMQQVPNKPPVVSLPLEENGDPAGIPEVQVEEPSPDYSACPNLNGPPRPGDKLAFKVYIITVLLSFIHISFSQGSGAVFNLYS